MRRTSPNPAHVRHACAPPITIGLYVWEARQSSEQDVSMLEKREAPYYEQERREGVGLGVGDLYRCRRW